jgi:hypothetical protein
MISCCLLEWVYTERVELLILFYTMAALYSLLFTMCFFLWLALRVVQWGRVTKPRTVKYY